MKTQNAIVAGIWGIVAAFGLFVLQQMITGDPQGDRNMGIVAAAVPPAVALYLALRSMLSLPFGIRLVAVILGAAMLGLMTLGATDCGHVLGSPPPGTWCALLD